MLSLQNGGVNSGHGFGSSGGVNSGGSKANELALELGWERMRNKVPTTVPELESHHPYYVRVFLQFFPRPGRWPSSMSL